MSVHEISKCKLFISDRMGVLNLQCSVKILIRKPRLDKEMTDSSKKRCSFAFWILFSFCRDGVHVGS